jgi:uncharacterized protein (TIGR03000 family)
MPSGYASMPAYGGYTSGYYSPDAGFYGAPAGGAVGAPGVAPAGTPGVAPAGTPGGRGAEDRGTPSDRDRGKDDGTSRESLAPAPATLIVTLPADATLAVDGYVSQSKAGTRSFLSPPLERGQDYHYTLKAELRRGDEPVTVSREVTVRAGRETRVTLEFPAASVAKK